jgi:hypothetical protein
MSTYVTTASTTTVIIETRTTALGIVVARAYMSTDFYSRDAP